jgi:hypothetical protein
MTNISNSPLLSPDWWNRKNVRQWGAIWAIVSLIFYIVWGNSMQGERAVWYRVLTSCFLLNIPLLVSGFLCLRNGFSSRMPSGSKVWLVMGIALLSFLVGSIWFSSWELLWELDPAGSLGDPFFIIFYGFLFSATLTAIIQKRIKLKSFQWFVLFGVGTYASLVVVANMSLQSTTATLPAIPPTAIAQAISTDRSDAIAPMIAPEIQLASSTEKPSKAPDWVLSLDGLFKPHAQSFNFFYVWSDVGLLCLSAMMIMGFWRSKANRAWIVNSFAIVCFYISDMWLAYAGNHVQEYQSGFFLEIFWTLGAILFGIAAVTEYDYMLARQDREEEMTQMLSDPE